MVVVVVVLVVGMGRQETNGVAKGMSHPIYTQPLAFASGMYPSIAATCKCDRDAAAVRCGASLLLEVGETRMLHDVPDSQQGARLARTRWTPSGLSSSSNRALGRCVTIAKVRLKPGQDDMLQMHINGRTDGLRCLLASQDQRLCFDSPSSKECSCTS